MSKIAEARKITRAKITTFTVLWIGQNEEKKDAYTTRWPVKVNHIYHVDSSLMTNLESKLAENQLTILTLTYTITTYVKVLFLC